MLINNLFNFSEKQTTSSNTLEATVYCDQSNRPQISTNWHVKDQQDCSRFKNIPEIIQTGITTIIININNNILLLSKLCELNLKNPCCDKHEDSLPYLMNSWCSIFTSASTLNQSAIEIFICQKIAQKCSKTKNCLELQNMTKINHLNNNKNGIDIFL